MKTKELQMDNSQIIFTKCFYKENISYLLDKNSSFIKRNSTAEGFEIFSYHFTDREKFNLSESKKNYSEFKEATIYVYEKSYIFISINYEIVTSENDVNSIGNAVFRVSHNLDNLVLPDKEIVNSIFNSLNYEDEILFLQPNGHTVKRHIFKKEDFIKYETLDKKDNTELFSFITYYYPVLKKIDDCSSSDIQSLKNATEGNSPSFSKKSKISPVEINDNYSLLSSNTGIGLIKTNKSNTNLEDFYLQYLICLKTIIHFEIKAKDFNREMDRGHYDNLDILSSSIRKEMRNAINIKYDIKNSLFTNDWVQNFYGKFLTSIGYDETLSEFIEICHSIEKEIKAAQNQNEEKHEKRLEKILSLVAVLAIVSVFKDGSDLIVSFIDALKKGFSIFDFSSLISLSSPLIALIVIIIILKAFNKKK